MQWIAASCCFYFDFPMPPPYIPCSTPASLYFDFPKLIGTYLCLYMCIICRFIVMKKRIKKYISRIGQNTGMSKTEKNVMTMLVAVPLVHASQNLNSGSRLANGRNSLPSDAVEGSPGPESSEGSSSGERKAMKLFSRKIPKPYATIKYPWTKYTRRKNKHNKNVKKSHLGTR
jgi:hypothetical protein